MPDNYSERLTPEQLDAIVAFLAMEETAVDSDPGFPLPPAIGQNDLPLGTSSGGTGAEPEETADSRLYLIPIITFVIILGLVIMNIRRRNSEEEEFIE